MNRRQFTEKTLALPKPMSADDILLRALGISQLCRTTIVETNICRIRKKIAAIGAKTTIETVRYSGYVIE